MLTQATDYKPFGALLKKLRKSRTLTARELALKVGVSVFYINSLEQGKAFTGTPMSGTLKTLDKIAVELGMTTEERTQFMTLAGFGPRSNILNLKDLSLEELFTLLKNVTCEIEQRTKVETP